MSKPITKKISSDAKKKWLTLGLVGAALLLIPRRSSRQDSTHEDSAYEDGSYKNSSHKNSLAADKLAANEIEKLPTDTQ